MKIKILVPFIESSWGGSHNSSSDLFCEIQKRHPNIDITIILPENSLAKRVFEINQLKVIEIRSVFSNVITRNFLARFFRLFILTFHAAYIIKKIKPQIIDVQDSQSLLVWGLVARLIGTKVVWHSRQFSTRKLLIFLRGFIAQRIICLGSNDPNMKYFPQKSEIISNIYDLNYLNLLEAIPKKEILCNEEKHNKLIVCVGNFSERKRQNFAIEVINFLHKRNIKASLLFIGDDKNMYGKQLKKIPLLMPSRVKFLGVKTRENTLRLIKSADLLIQTSISEAGPRVVFEALFLNTKVVSTNVGNVNLIQSENLYIADIDDKALFFDGVEKALSSPWQLEKISFPNPISAASIVPKTLLTYEKIL